MSRRANWPTIAARDVPTAPVTDRFRLEPLHPRHNSLDHAAWMSSIDHIRSTPGFGDGTWGPDPWPFAMSADDNLADLEMHWREFGDGDAYAFSVVDVATDDVIGCVYIDPDTRPESVSAPELDRSAAMVRSWVRESHAELDRLVVDVVDGWLASAWPFDAVRWPGRDLRR